MPQMDGCLDFSGGKRIFSTSDASYAHLQIEMDDLDEDDMTFKSYGPYKF